MAQSWRALSSAPSFGALCVVALSGRTCGSQASPLAARSPVAVAPAAERSPSRQAVPPELAGDPALVPIDGYVQDAIATAQLPGAVVIVGRHDRILFRRAYGDREVEPERVPMTIDTLFDLASLTKPIATATSIMALAERHALSLDDKLAKYVPECAANGKQAITLRHLLLHVAGLPADIAVDDYASGREEAVRRMCAIRARAAPGVKSVYSDVGFLLLEEVVRRVTSRELPDFAAETIFTPLGMKDTGFQPSGERKERAAWTENVDGMWRAGVVHDPRAFVLGGVAGHAGLFATADDVALYARAILGHGAVQGRRILSRESVAAMIAPYDVPGGVRALGWSVQNQWRGDGLSPRAVGHFGWTGTAVWIDPEKDLFTVILTNRVHPDGKGDSKPLVARINTLVAHSIGPAVGRSDDCPERPDDVRPGIDVLRDEHFESLRGAHVGLITNASGRARDGTSTIDVLRNAPGVTLAALFSPEHGIRSDQQGRVASGTDEQTGLPVYSLYGESLSPTAESLAGVDTLVFDIQDVGTRFFTYASTMRRAMDAAQEHGLRFVVLDRPNPIDGVDVAGPVLVPLSRSFVNYHSLPVRHGMTVGELAYLFNAEDHLGLALSVVPVRGWRRSTYWDETGLPWINPSPNLRSVDEALLYPAIGLLEATNLSVGRGTDAPFERMGAPWIDGAVLAAAVDEEALPGVAIAPEKFTPSSDRYGGQLCGGLRLSIRDRTQFEPVRTGLAIARALRRVYGAEWDFAKLDRLLVQPETMAAIEMGLPLSAIVDTYRGQLEAFAAKREKYLLYGTGDCAVAVSRAPAAAGGPKDKPEASR